MEMIIGCIFLTVLLLILLIFCKKVTFSIEIRYPETNYINMDTLYDKDGNPVQNKEKASFDTLLKTVNEVMYDTEVEDDE